MVLTASEGGRTVQARIPDADGSRGMPTRDVEARRRDEMAERTRAGMAAARQRGVILGNPLFIAGDGAAIARMKETWRDRMLAVSRDTSGPWLEVVRAHRPLTSWSRVTDMVEARTGARMTTATLKRHVRRLVAAGDLPAAVMARAPMTGNGGARETARRIAREDPGKSLRGIGRELQLLGVTPARAATWSAASVSLLLGDGS